MGGDFLLSPVSFCVDLREVAALIVAAGVEVLLADDSAVGEDGVAVPKAADIERIAAADDESADTFGEEEEVPPPPTTEGEDDSDGDDSVDEDGEGRV